MSAPTVLEIPYGGAISGEEGDLNAPIKEFYRLPLKQKNEITVVVQASTDARIILYDGDTGPDVSTVKVEVVIGGDKNSTVSIGLVKDDGTGKYPKEVVQKAKLLSATHSKAFIIRWWYGRVMVYSHGFKKPMIIWDGPKEGAFSHIGVRTVGCSGDWRVQGLPKFTTADGAEYKDMQINCGRLDFEVSALRDAYIMFTAQPTAARTPAPMHCVLGCGSTKRSAVFFNYQEQNPVEEIVPTLSTNEYRRFWCKWDANNFMIGRGDSTSPFTQWLKCGTPVKPIRYFGLQGHPTVNDYCFWHILDEVREEDTVERKPGQQNYIGNELGWTSTQYNAFL